MALLPPQFLDTVVAIGIDAGDDTINWIASGFLYGHMLNSSGDTGEYRTYLVTNRHVVEGLHEIYLRFNPLEDKPAKEYRVAILDTTGNPLWVTDQIYDSDVAVMPINTTVLKSDNIRFHFFRGNTSVADTEMLDELGVSEGDFVYVLGFPLGIVGEFKNVVIVRGGIIARIRDMLEGSSENFWIDASVFPGNSGGPVILKPEIAAIRGTKTQKSAYLVGIVASYLPYEDVAISQQTGRPKVIFSENSGLAVVYSVDCIMNAIEAHINTHSQEKAQITEHEPEDT